MTDKETDEIQRVKRELTAFFPFPTIRSAQESSLGKLAAAHVQGKTFSILEIPTGGGKSGIGMAAARWSAACTDGASEKGAHYLTSQNSLAQQLINDFGEHGLVGLRGKDNYRCAENAGSCGTGFLLNGGKYCDFCPYRAAKARYQASPMGVTNYTYYLTEAKNVGELPCREYLILDEAHNVEREVLSMVEVTIREEKVQTLGLTRLPLFDFADQDGIIDWLGRIFQPELRKFIAINQARVEAEKVSSTMERKALARLQRTTQEDSSMAECIQMFLDERANADWMGWSDMNTGNLMLKPLTAAHFAQKYLFRSSPNVVLMSATILDFTTFSRNLGISREDAVRHRVASEFPKENRRIIYWPVGSMSAKNIETTLPRQAQRIEVLLNKFNDRKGIIHTHSYKINRYLMEALGATVHHDRLLTHTNVKGDRERVIGDHFATNLNTFLVSPSMTEGLDLKDDLSRVQIITKVPYPYLDPYTRVRMERDPAWYQLQTALTLMQASGRSIRSDTDHALTIITDLDFERFLNKNQSVLPQWWLDSIEFK